jgi:hypothetical protein
MKNLISYYSRNWVVSATVLLVAACSEETIPPIDVGVSTDVVKNITVSEATSGGFLSITGTGTVASKGVCWSTSPSPTVNGQKTNDGGGTGAFVSFMTGLQGNTRYFVRAYAIANGITFYGNELTFTTLAPLGTLSGRITDPFDGKLKNVSVKLLQSGQVVKQTTSDANGDYKFENIGYATYSVELALNGFVKKTENVTLNAPVQTFNAKMEPESLPSGAIAAARTISYSGNSVTFELDLLVVDASGAVVTGLSAANFSINNFQPFVFSISSAVLNNSSANSAYSASMLLDQSGSITGTDPNDSRIQAAKIFMSSLGPGDNVHLSAFAGFGRLIPFETTIYGNGFTSNGASYFSTLDQLANLEGGGTPLYKSTNAMIDFVGANAPNANKALMVFTDGQDTEGGFTISQITANARNRNVKLFTIGLSNSVDTKVLAEMAFRGNGSFIWASDARQLVSAYKSLGALLRGTSALYRTRWTANSATTSFPGWLTTSVRVNLGTTTISIPFYLSVPN